MVIGAEVSTADRKETLARARARAASIPDLLVEAERVVNTVMNGWHGRRKRGPGENFWQFRPYVQGESLAPHRLAAVCPRRPHLCSRP